VATSPRMTLDEFNSLAHDLQVRAVFETGSFLAARWENGLVVSLYYLLGGLFVEVYDDMQAKRIVKLHPFTDSAFLEAYAAGVKLPPDLEIS
jgi:hypothetical protein